MTVSVPCPRCAADNAPGARDCGSCGIIFAKWRPQGPRRDAASPEPPRPAAVAAGPWIALADPTPPPPQTLGIAHAGWRSAAIGLGMAFVLTFFPFLSFILSPLTTMVHEIGHTVALWLFGYPAIPAFDFGSGGGVTMSDQERAPAVVWAWALGLGALGFRRRENTRVLAALGATALLYFWMFNSTRETLAITLAGHAGEVVFAAVFLYRGLTGWGCRIDVERPLYAFLGFTILLGSIKLGMNLLGSPMERHWYLQGKGGIDNDLVTGAQILGWRLEGAARALVLFTALAIPASFVAASMRKRIGALAEAEEEV